MSNSANSFSFTRNDKDCSNLFEKYDADGGEKCEGPEYSIVDSFENGYYPHCDIKEVIRSISEEMDGVFIFECTDDYGTHRYRAVDGKVRDMRKVWV